MENQCTHSTTIERKLRGIAGVVVIAGVFLTYFHHINWIWFLLFVGLNLLQSAFTNWCPMITMLKKCCKK